ncbi:hypothetical protein EB1_06120 [Empedobacter brevis NBRC 14943 = ATCC 43319]|uniref:Uncharacterized protein n=1 Tax=Empedobacter brevis NBRC 14943 = ATCC 43319 TaxID=1218108 RepID=A0A511NDD3_9FLAO|nr:hypothetical protein EB1_06120 [Empedobacter brevis NBRC 14943 = ATCC 43319]
MAYFFLKQMITTLYVGIIISKCILSVVMDRHNNMFISLKEFFKKNFIFFGGRKIIRYYCYKLPPVRSSFMEVIRL